MRFGPLQVAAFEFGPNAMFEGQILNELESLGSPGVVRVVDMLIVHRDESGDLIAIELPGENALLGGIIGALLGFEFEGEQPTSIVEPGLEHDNGFGLTLQGLAAFAAQIRIGATVGIVLLEHAWASGLRDAIVDAGGYVLGYGFLGGDAVDEIAIDIAAMVDALKAVEVTTSVGTSA